MLVPAFFIKRYKVFYKEINNIIHKICTISVHTDEDTHRCVNTLTCINMNPRRRRKRFINAVLKTIYSLKLLASSYGEYFKQAVDELCQAHLKLDQDMASHSCYLVR